MGDKNEAPGRELQLCGLQPADIQSAAKEAARWMTKPCRDDQGKAARIGIRLNGNFRRVVQLFSPGRGDRVIGARSDSDCARRPGARKSTSGEVL